MLEIRSAPRDLRRYLWATRGRAAEYLRYPTDRMARFFGDCLESWDPLDADLSGVKLVFVDSHRGDFEHLHLDEGSCIIFDQSFLEVLGLVSDSAIRSLSLGMAPEGPYPSILSAFYAARHLALGDLFDAVFDANICRNLRRNDPSPYDADERRRNAWVELQGCFTIGHEIMHTKIADGGGAILASLTAEDYRRRMLPHVRHMDQGSNLKDGDWTEQWRQVPGTEDLMVPQVVRPDLSWESRLNWIVETQDAFGQEVLCDYGAALAVSRNLGNNILSPDECLLACYVALVARIGMQTVERRIVAYTPSVRTIPDTLRIATELRTRVDFLRMALTPMARNGAYKDISRIQNGEEQVKERMDEQWSRLEDTLIRFDKAWVWPFLRLVAKGSRLGSENGERDPWPDDFDVDDLVQASEYVRSSIGVPLRL